MLAYIRYSKLFLYATDEDGDPIRSWTQYVKSISWRVNVSTNWLFSRTHVFFLGLCLGFTLEQLFDIDPLTLDLAKNFVSLDKRGDLILFNEDKLGISEDMSDEEKLAFLRQFIMELNVLPPDERVKRVKGDILKKVRYFFMVRDDGEIVYRTTNDATERLLRDAPPHVMEVFKRKIKDKSAQYG
ncbi:MAG: hypothetical protein ABIM59_04965, partial [candidate division WOR-3 bacterium]